MCSSEKSRGFRPSALSPSRHLAPRVILVCHPAVSRDTSAANQGDTSRLRPGCIIQVSSAGTSAGYCSKNAAPAGELTSLQALKGKQQLGCESARVGEAQLMMLGRDFGVTSPVRENLLVTIALMKRGGSSEVLIGQFTAFSSFVNFSLCRDALRVKHEQNAGGSSTISESLSVEYFARRFQAQDVVTEMEVEYFSSNWKKVDYICNLYGQRVGVSVTRAMCYPDPAEFSPEIAHQLLCKKLYGLVVARDGVSARHSFCKCILHVWCETRRTAQIVRDVYSRVRRELQVGEDVILVLTVADGERSRPIFYEHLC